MVRINKENAKTKSKSNKIIRKHEINIISNKS